MQGIISLDKKGKRIQERKGGPEAKPFQKVVNLKLGIPNLFLVYSPLMKSGISLDQKTTSVFKERPRLTKLSAQAFPSL